MPRKRTAYELESPEEAPQEFAAAEAPKKTSFTAEELLAEMPEPIMCPSQRQYGEEFYPKYARFYESIRAAAAK